MVDPKDVESCEVVGQLNGNDVKMLKTKGGFHLFVGKPKSNGKEVVLAGTSHRAIGLYKLKKEHNGFQQTLQKSESDLLPQVKELQSNSKYDLYTLENNGYKAICAYNCGVEVMSVLLKKEEDAYYTHSINAELAKKLPQAEKDLLATILAKAMANV